eukprot:COSAG02_NODE_393_length_23190_cov_56.721926_12_plen_370_part_00
MTSIADIIMTPEQRYMLDSSGYLILRGALSSKQIEDARMACDSYVEAQENADAGRAQLPPGFPGNGGPDAIGSRMIYANGFAWCRCLERLLFHEATWPIVLELTGSQPLMNGGVTLYDDFSRGNAHAMGGFMHCKRDAQKRNPDALDPDCTDPAGYCEPVYCRAREDGTIESDNFVIFPYFDDVGPNDGGIFLLPGSHKSPLPRPETLFGSIGQTGSQVAGRDFGSNHVIAHDAAWDDSSRAHKLIPGKRPIGGKIPEGCVKPEMSAGDILIMPEATLHCVIPWRAEGRMRRALMLRHDLQHRGAADAPGQLKSIVHPLTAELMSFAPKGHLKAVAKMSAAEIQAAFDVELTTRQIPVVANEQTRGARL